MLYSEKLAIAAHLHVLLRRKAGRVTDTEWLASNAEYAREIIRVTRLKAAEDGHADLGDWADKLEQAFATEAAAPAAGLALAQAKALGTWGGKLRTLAPGRKPASPEDPGAADGADLTRVAEERYVGRLR